MCVCGGDLCFQFYFFNICKFGATNVIIKIMELCNYCLS